MHPRAGPANIYDDSSDEEAYTGEQREFAREVDELRVARHWINQEGSDAAAEARAFSSATGQELDLRLDWSDVRKKDWLRKLAARILQVWAAGVIHWDCNGCPWESGVGWPGPSIGESFPDNL